MDMGGEYEKRKETENRIMDENKKQILNAVKEGDYEKAEALFQKGKEQAAWYDDVAAILDAAIGEYFEDRMRMWEAIRSGLMHNCRNYELYVMLGNYYLQENPNQSWLCYENALFYCDVPEDRDAISQLLCQLEEQHHITVAKTSVVILSFNLLEYTKLCIESIRMTTSESAREIIVVDNGSRDGSVEWLREQEDIVLVENEENVGFPAGCNQGILAGSRDSDVFLLNNDTVLPANALFWLRMGLYEQEEVGSVGSVTNFANNQTVIEGVDDAAALLAFGEKRNIPMKYPYEDRLYLIGFALLIRRSVIKKAGLLDERFSPGNSEDLDYGLRVLMSGHRNVLCKNSFILHFGSKSFGKDPEKHASAIGNNLQKLKEKWGFDVGYYSFWREELIRLIEEPAEKPMRLLDIGCGCGALMARARSLYPNLEAYGVELVPEVAKFASCMGTVLCGDVETLDFPWEEASFDYIIMGDVLEHLMTPEKLLNRLRKYLKPDGHIIVSMPNVKHYSVMLPLLQRDEFSYSDAGILDRTHVKMYTGVEIQKLLLRCGYRIETLGYTVMGKPDEDEDKMIDMLNSLMERPARESFLAYQYILRARCFEC